ncbi:hypothetical protein UR09_05270 [Candidatus Nitromaritima sp. SCGC AAA799-A02]|nr:hypothetical protein UR09_05270 [Candidatus Nitromaritima sp. SCGC AAA799-A02]
MKLAAFNINFDSLGYEYGFPAWYNDPSFFSIADRFFDLAERYKFKYTIFVIGRDLEKPENREAVQKWADHGHEIGNHSWSHGPDLVQLEKGEVRREVEKAHEIIFKATGLEPKGFLSRGWVCSEPLLEILLDLNYEYDTSQFPSWLALPMILKIWLNRRQMNESENKILNFQNLIYPFFGRRSEFLSMGKLYAESDLTSFGSQEKKIAILPLPTTRLRFPCWHTLAYVFGRSFHKRILQACLNQAGGFYYLMHPADLMVKEDLMPDRPCYFSRINFPLQKKIEILEESILMIINSGRKMVTMRELAWAVLGRLPSSP